MSSITENNTTGILNFYDLLNNITAEFIVVAISLLITYLIYRSYKKIKAKVGFQTYIMTETSYITCTKDYTIRDIPNILQEYKDKLNIENKKEDKVFFWNTRISTYLIFTDGVNILLYNRKENSNKEQIINPKLDCYGAVAFNNNTLKYKLPNTFLESKILDIRHIPGIVIEENELKFNLFKPNKISETVVMVGFIVFVSNEDLKKGLNIDTNYNIDENDNIIKQISCIEPDDENLTAKAKLGIKYLKMICIKGHNNNAK